MNGFMFSFLVLLLFSPKESQEPEEPIALAARIPTLTSLGCQNALAVTRTSHVTAHFIFPRRRRRRNICRKPERLENRNTEHMGAQASPSRESPDPTPHLGSCRAASVRARERDTCTKKGAGVSLQLAEERRAGLVKALDEAGR